MRRVLESVALMILVALLILAGLSLALQRELVTKLDQEVRELRMAQERDAKAAATALDLSFALQRELVTKLDQEVRDLRMSQERDAKTSAAILDGHVKTLRGEITALASGVPTASIGSRSSER